jgi:hypothetical protein
MKQVIQQENAIKLLLTKKQEAIKNEMAFLDSTKTEILSVINSLEKRIIDNPSPIKLNQKVDVSILTNYNSFSYQVNDSLSKLQKELNVVNSQIISKQQELNETLVKEKIFTQYFDKIKKNKQYILDKREDAIMQDQYNSIKSLMRGNF